MISQPHRRLAEASQVRGTWRYASLLVSLLLLGAMPVQALHVPELTAPVMDEAGVIGGRGAQLLDQILREANARGKVQLTVLTLPSLEGEAIEQASIEITDKWKLGAKGKDNGVLFLVVPSEKKMRIEVGQGLEGDIPDLIANRILNEISRPYFKKGLYGDGILAGSIEILRHADPEFSVKGYTQQPVSSDASGDQLPGWAQLLILIVLLVIFVFGRLLGFGGWGGFGGGGFGGGGFGGGSGGGWSGGGGGFSGGGSSGSW